MTHTAKNPGRYRGRPDQAAFYWAGQAGFRCYLPVGRGTLCCSEGRVWFTLNGFSLDAMWVFG